MNKQIHELRTRIDGLAALVDSLYSTNVRGIVDTAYALESSIATQIVFDVNNKSLLSGMNIYECHKSLLLAKAWLGKALAELGEETPYKNDGNRKEEKDIEPVADCQQEQCSEDSLIPMALHFPRVAIKGTEVGGICDSKEMNHIEKVDWLRGEISACIGWLLQIGLNESVWSDETKLANNHLAEARFHLGFELQRIKESPNNPINK